MCKDALLGATLEEEEVEGEKQKEAGGKLCIDRKHVDSIHLGGGEIDIPGLLCPCFEYLSWWNLW